MKRCLIVLMALVFTTCFYGLAAAEPDGSEGYNCSACHRGRPDQTPPGQTPKPTPIPQPPVIQPPMPGNPGPFIGLPPIAEAGSNLTVLPGAFSALNGYFSTDPDGRIVSYVWIQTGGTPVGLFNTWTPTPFFEAPIDPQTLVFTLVVSDDNGNLAYDTVTATVLGGNTSVPPSNDGDDEEDDDDDDDD